MATPRSNCACTVRSQEVGNETVPSVSGCAEASPGRTTTRIETSSAVKMAMGPSLPPTLGMPARCVQCVLVAIIHARNASIVDLRHLRAFMAVVDAGGFGRAAGRLHLSQSALSRQVHALETAMDVRLFDRISRRVQLTSEGEDLLGRARQLLADVDSLGDRARALKAGESGILRMGATPQAMEAVLAGFLPRYRRRHPGVEVHL